MQKKVIALAVAGLVSGAAFAQSNVTIYGVADATFEQAKATGAVAATGNRGSFSRVNTNSSLIGFKGSESLGNGLNAIFQFESGVAFDSAGGALAGGRDSFVGLQSANMGTVKLGLQTGPTRLLGAMVDMNAGATGPGANSSIIGKAGGTSATGANTGSNFGFFDTRLSNSISYTSPSFSGFTVAGAYSAGENKSLDQAAANSVINTSAYDLGATYNNGPIMVGLTYGKLNQRLDATNTNTAGTATMDSSRIYRLAGSYTFNGGHKIAALYEQTKNDYDRASVSTELKRKVYGISGKFMVTPQGGLIAQYYHAANASGNFLATNDSTGANLYEIGYEHSLSKRTMLKASWSKMSNKSNAVYDFGVGAVGGSWTAGADPQVFAAGIRHVF